MPLGGGVADVDGAEHLLLVPVEGERAQGALQVVDEGEVVGEACRRRGPACAGGAAGGFEGADGVVGAERARQSAALAGEVGEGVEPGGEGRLVVFGAEAGGEGVEALGEAAALAPSVGAAGGAVVAEGGPLDAAPRGGVGVGAAHVARADGPGVRGQRGGGAGGSEGVDIELVLPEPVYEPFAPESGLTGGVRVATLREQCDPHECTPDLP